MKESLRDLRTKAGLTQELVAEKVGISRAAYTHIERGTKQPSLDVALRLASLLGRSVEDLFGSSKQ